MSDDYDPPTCPICEAEQVRAWCLDCNGYGGREATGAWDGWIVCERCHGQGRRWVCSRLPHTAEQMEAYRASGNARRDA